MPRRTVTFEPGGYYHIYNRGAGGARSFNRENYRFALELLNRYLAPLHLTMIAIACCPITITGWCGRMARQRQACWRSVCSMRTARHSTTATTVPARFFEDRYSAPLTSDEYLRHLCRYIHANPVRHGIADRRWSYGLPEPPGWIEGAAGQFGRPGLCPGTFSGAGAVSGVSVASYVSGQVKLPDGRPRIWRN